MTYQGTFIVLEGVDGSGKATQFNLLAERLKAVGYDVAVFDFPRYDKASSHFVKQYLNGNYGPASEVSPYSAALFYALDRFEAAPEIHKAIEDGKIVLSNRYVGSSMAHQGSKFTNEAEQRGFFIWVESLEYQLLNIPRPNLNIFLRVPAELSYELIGRKARRAYTDRKHDEHEADIEHLRRAAAAYDSLCRLFPRDFQAIDCTTNSQLLGVPAINDLIWQTIRPLLPEKPPHRARATVVNLDTKVKEAPAENTSNKDSISSPTNISLLALVELAKHGLLNLDDQPPIWKNIQAGRTYYQPPELEPEILKKYRTAIEQLLERKQHLRHVMIDKQIPAPGPILNLVTPMASYVSLELPKINLVGLPDSDRLAEMKLFDSSQPTQAKKNTSKKRLEDLIRERMPSNLSTALEPTTLIEAWPRNEFDILSDSLYGLSELPRRELQAGLELWTYDQKYQALRQTLTELDNSVARQIRYRFDVIAEQSLLIELLQSGLIQNLQSQPPTPRYGYSVPPVLEQAGIDSEFIECFDLSLELYSQLQGSADERLAAYGILAGHKSRFQFNCDLEGLIKVGNNSSNSLKSFREDLIDKIGETHPIIAEYLKELAKVVPKTAVKSQAVKPRRSRRRRSR